MQAATPGSRPASGAAQAQAARRRPDAFHDYELLEYLLSLIIPRFDTEPLAKRLLHDFGGIGPLLSASPDALRREKLSGDGANLAIDGGDADGTGRRALRIGADVVEPDLAIADHQAPIAAE